MTNGEIRGFMAQNDILLHELMHLIDFNDELGYVSFEWGVNSVSSFKNWNPGFNEITESFQKIADVYMNALNKADYKVIHNLGFKLDTEGLLNIKYIFELQRALRFSDDVRNELLSKYMFYYLSTIYYEFIDNLKHNAIDEIRKFKNEYLDVKDYLAKYNMPLTLKIDEMIKNNVSEVRGRFNNRQL